MIEIARGLAMKFAPPEGRAPLIFETLKPVLGHSELNAVRAKSWDYNGNPLELSKGWIVPEKAELAQGDLVVLTSGNNGIARSLSTVARDEKAKLATLGFNTPPDASIMMKTGDILLITEPDGVQLGLPRTVGNYIVIKIDGADSYSAGAIVEVRYMKDNKAVSGQAVVIEGAKGHLTIEISETISEEVTGDVTVEAFTPYAVDAWGGAETSIGIRTVYYKRSSGTGDPVISQTSTKTRTDTEKDIAQTHARPTQATGWAFARSSGKTDKGKSL